MKAGSVGTNASYIRKILALLKKAEIVESHRGISGYSLTVIPEQLTLLQIYQAVMEESKIHLLDIHQNPCDQCIVGRHIRPVLNGMFAEMEDAAKESGFRVVAAVASVAEHSIMPQYAAGRPDASDKKQLEQFAAQIAGKSETAVSIPGNRPYRKAGGAGLVPKAGKGCTKCGLCATNCPVQAIDPVRFAADSKKCISCMRCVKQCQANARKVNGAMVAVASMALKKACSVRKENELFL